MRRGESFSLAVDLKREGIQVGQPVTRHNPILTPTSLNERDQFAPGIWKGTDDLLTMSTCAGTHIDCLSHVSYDDELYGGKPIDQITAAGGAAWCGAEKLNDIVTRGILLDIPRFVGEEWLDPGFSISGEMLESATNAVGIQIESGDVALVRTGDIRHYFEDRRDRYAKGEEWNLVGLAPDVAEWTHANNIAGCFVDTYAYEVFPPPTGNWDDLLALHLVHLRDMGMLQGQNWNFEELAEDCETDDVYECMLVAAPEPIVGATSAPVVPLAIK